MAATTTLSATALTTPVKEVSSRRPRPSLSRSMSVSHKSTPERLQEEGGRRRRSLFHDGVGRSLRDLFFGVDEEEEEEDVSTVVVEDDAHSDVTMDTTLASDDRSARDALARGDALRARGDHDGATRAWREAVRRGDAATRARALVAMGASAETRAREATDPAERTRWFAAAVGRYRSAARSFAEDDDERGTVDARARTGNVLCDMRDPEGARRQYDDVPSRYRAWSSTTRNDDDRIEPTTWARMVHHLSVFRYDERRWSDAASYMTDLLTCKDESDVDPLPEVSRLELLYRSGKALLRAKDHDGAASRLRTFLKEVVEETSAEYDVAGAHRSLAVCCEETGRVAEAAEHLRAYLERRLRLRFRGPLALTRARLSVRDGDGVRAAWRRLAALLSDAGDHDAAGRLWEEAARTTFGDDRAAARTYARADEAYALAGDDESRARTTRARLARLERAASDASSRDDDDDDDVLAAEIMDCRDGLARLCGRARNLPAALTHLRACLNATTRPTDAPNVTNQLLRRVASYEASAERYDEAEEACRQVLDDDDADDESVVLALCVVGTCRAKRSDRAGTVDAFEEALRRSKQRRPRHEDELARATELYARACFDLELYRESADRFLEAYQLLDDDDDDDVFGRLDERRRVLVRGAASAFRASGRHEETLLACAKLLRLLAEKRRASLWDDDDPPPAEHARLDEEAADVYETMGDAHLRRSERRRRDDGRRRPPRRDRRDALELYRSAAELRAGLGHRDAASRLALRATALLASFDETRRTRKAADARRRRRRGVFCGSLSAILAGTSYRSRAMTDGEATTTTTTTAAPFFV